MISIITVSALLALSSPASCFDLAKVANSLKEGYLIPLAMMFPSRRTVGPNEGLQIIGAGLPRTGTMSTDAALRRLGHRVYRFDDIMRTPTHKKRWIQAATDWKEQNDLTEVRKLVEEIEEAGYTATLDFPMCFFAPAFAEIRPNAKVILTLRDTPEKWVSSFLFILTAVSFTACRPWKWLLRGNNMEEYAEKYFALFGMDMKFPNAEYPRHIARPLPWVEYVHTGPMDNDEWRKRWIDFYNMMNAKVQETIPSDQLLVFDVKEGWTPLIPFLGLDPMIADEPFPHLNDRQSVARARLVGRTINALFPFFVLGVLFSIYNFAQWILRLVQSKESKEKTH